jgi:hypothetical protein
MGIDRLRRWLVSRSDRCHDVEFLGIAFLLVQKTRFIVSPEACNLEIMIQDISQYTFSSPKFEKSAEPKQ